MEVFLIDFIFYNSLSHNSHRNSHRSFLQNSSCNYVPQNVLNFSIAPTIILQIPQNYFVSVLTFFILDKLSKGETLGISISTTEDSVIACAPLTNGFPSFNGPCYNKTTGEHISYLDIENSFNSNLCAARKNYFFGRCPVFTENLEFNYSEIPCYTGIYIF